MVESTANVSAQVLIVEDEAEIRELISLLLQRLGHRVKQCSSASQALEVLKTQSYDLIILDWMLPDFSGIDFLKTADSYLKRRPPVLMVTAKAEPADIVQGLEAGADDYLAKPFEPSVFGARVKALLRRSMLQQPEAISSDQIRVGQLSINLSSYEVRCAEQPIQLTPSEFKILAELAQNQGRVLTRDHLISVVQGEGISVTGRTIDTHVFGMRKKLGSCSDWIETIRGVGYRVKSE